MIRIHEIRLAAGLCWRCGAPRNDKSKRLCDIHLDYEWDRKRPKRPLMASGRPCFRDSRGMPR